MATGQVLFHRFYCKKSLAKFDVKVLLTYLCFLRPLNLINTCGFSLSVKILYYCDNSCL